MKFREWLIHKLGGYTKNDLKLDVSSYFPTNIVKFKTKKLCAQYETTHFERTKEFENNMKRYLCEQLSRQLFDYCKFNDNYMFITNSMIYRIEIEILDYNGDDKNENN